MHFRSIAAFALSVVGGQAITERMDSNLQGKSNATTMAASYTAGESSAKPESDVQHIATQPVPIQSSNEEIEVSAQRDPASDIVKNRVFTTNALVLRLKARENEHRLTDHPQVADKGAQVMLYSLYGVFQGLVFLWIYLAIRRALLERNDLEAARRNV